MFTAAGKLEGGWGERRGAGGEATARVQRTDDGDQL